MLYRVLIFCLLFGTWMVFSGIYDVFHLTLGVISAACVTWMSSDMLFEHRDFSLGQRIRQGVGLIGYLVWLLYQIVLSNIDVLKVVLFPGGMKDVEPSIVKFRTGLKSEFGKFLLANSITLTPGTVTVRIVGEDFYVHALNEKAAAGLNGEMERRIARVFEPDNAFDSLGSRHS